MDSNPSLSLNDAEDKVKASLCVNTSLFDSSSDILALANKISAAIESMFKKLAADFNITISKNAILLVMNEILPQLSSIADGTKAPEQVANATIGNKDENTIGKKMDELSNNMPSVQTAQDAFRNGLQAYMFRRKDSSYLFQLYDISNSAMRAFTDGDYQSALPTTLSQNTNTQSASLNNDGSVVFSDGGGTLKILGVEAIQMEGKSLESNPRLSKNTITFPAGAILYKLNVITAAPIIDVDVLRANNCSYNAGFTCTNARVNNNTIEIRWPEDGESYDIVMKNDGTYNVKRNNELSKYDMNAVFSSALTPPSGKYTRSTDSHGDVYSFKNVDGIVVFKVFSSGSGYQSYYLSGRFHYSLVNTEFMFNETAAESIQRQW